MEKPEIISEIINSIVSLEGDRITELSLSAVEQGVPPLEVINDGLTVGLRKIGDLFSGERIFLPELIKAGSLVTQTMDKMKPYLSGKSSKVKARFLIATVQGDVHDIGKNLVKLLLSASGYEVIDLGKDVSSEKIVKSVIEYNPDILGLSALLSTTMPGQLKVIQEIEEAGIRDKLKIMVGGAPVTRKWAEEIGSDGFAEDASSAVKEADRIIGTE